MPWRQSQIYPSRMQRLVLLPQDYRIFRITGSSGLKAYFSDMIAFPRVSSGGNNEAIMSIRLSNGKEIPIEMHKIRIVQKMRLAPAQERLQAIEEAGYNTFLLRTRDIFLDMLTDSGTNAMSDNQLAAMMVADDAYAGSESFYRLLDAVKDIFGLRVPAAGPPGPRRRAPAGEDLRQARRRGAHELPLHHHQGPFRAGRRQRAGDLHAGGAEHASGRPFKGNMDLGRLKDAIDKYGAKNVSFVRMEATTNLIGGQPFSLANLQEVKALIEPQGIFLVVDCSLISENAYFIKQREPGYENAGDRRDHPRDDGRGGSALPLRPQERAASAAA